MGIPLRGEQHEKVQGRGTGYGERGWGTGTETENGDRKLGRGTRMGYNWKGNDCSCDR